MCGLLDCTVRIGNIDAASASSTSDAGSWEAYSRAGLWVTMATDWCTTRLQCPAGVYLRLLRVQDATSTGQLQRGSLYHILRTSFIADTSNLH